MEHVLTEIEFSGCIKLISNELDEYIVYEQILQGDFIPVQDGVYKFRFRPGHTVRREYLNYNTFVNDYKNKQNNGFTHINIYDDDFDLDQVISSEFIKTCILNTPPVKYQIMYS